MRTAAVLPVKSFARAKQRIGRTLAPQERAALAEAMVGDVLDALAAVRGLDEILVVTREPRAASIAESAGAAVLEDPDEAGHIPAALLGAAEAAARGAERVLLVPGDCPALDPDEVERLLAGAAPREVAIVPDRHGTGTNALLLAPPDVMTPSFGPGSFARHVALAQAAGATVRIADVPSLALDVDTFDDLEALLTARPGAALRTRATLARAA